MCVFGDQRLWVDRPFAARAYADPVSGDGKLPGAQERFAKALSVFDEMILPEKTSNFQISGGSCRHGVDA